MTPAAYLGMSTVPLAGITLLGGWSDVAAACAWPLAVLIAAWWYRKPLGTFLSEVGRRATALKLFEFELTLPEASAYSGGDSGGFPSDLRHATSAVFIDSSTWQLFNQLAENPAFDFAIVDLGEGEEWLTSRLFMLSIILRRMRGCRALVFLAHQEDLPRTFLGWARPDHVRWRLAQCYPWLETAYAKAAAKQNATVTSYDGALQPSDGQALTQGFVAELQRSRRAGEEWVPLSRREDNKPKYEHAAWISITRLREDLGEVLREDSMREDPDEPRDARVLRVLRREGPFIPLVDDRGRLRRLVDRRALLEDLANERADTESSRL